MMDNWDVSTGNWFGMAIFMVIGLVLVALMVTLISRGAVHGSSQRRDDGLAVLQRRFAAGEIDEAEFRSRRETMGL